MVLKLFMVLFLNYPIDDIQLTIEHNHGDSEIRYTITEIFSDSVSGSTKRYGYNFRSQKSTNDYVVRHSISLIEALIWKAVIYDKINKKRSTELMLKYTKTI